MTRQRIRPSLKRSVYKECPACIGSGLVKSAESMAIEAVRKLLMAMQTPNTAKVILTVHEEVGTYLNNKKRRELARIEDDYRIQVIVIGQKQVSPEHLQIVCEDPQGRDLKFEDG
jgi:ribonuclease E